MTKQLLLLFSIINLISFNAFCQTENQSNESKTKVYKYKLKLSPINLDNKVDLQFYNQNIQNSEIFETTVGNFNFDLGFGQEQNQNLVNTLISDSVNNDPAKIIDAYKYSTLKSINFDSAKVDVYQNNEFNVSTLTLGGDTLIGVKRLDEPTITYYYISKKGNYISKSEMGSLIALHSTQNMFNGPDLPTSISNHSVSIKKIKFLNVMYASTFLLTNEINEVDNLICNFQYPNEPNSFPIQFNLFKNKNKYCFELTSEKTISNSKAINKKVKVLNEKKFDKLPLNELFQMVGFEY